MNIDIISLKGLHERFCHTIALRAIIGGATGFQVDRLSKGDRIFSQIVETVVRQPLNLFWRLIYLAKAVFERLHHQITYIICVDPAGGRKITQYRFTARQFLDQLHEADRRLYEQALDAVEGSIGASDFDNDGWFTNVDGDMCIEVIE